MYDYDKQGDFMDDLIEFFIKSLVRNIEEDEKYNKIISASAQKNYIKERLSSISKQLVEVCRDDGLGELRDHKHLVWNWAWSDDDSDETSYNSGITDSPNSNPVRGRNWV